MKNKLLAWLIPIVIGLVIWFIPAPEGLKPAAWHLAAIFIATVVAFITGPMSMGALSLTSIVVVCLTQVLKTNEALAGFSNATIWLIVAAFLLSRGFVKTGLGKRIAYMLISAFGKSSLSLAYTLLFSDLILAPATPSNTARAGGVIYPIATSLASAFKSSPADGTARKIGSFIMQTIYQGNTVTSAMFMTSMAGNTLIVTLVAQSFDIHLSWGLWALAAILPGLVSLLVIPPILYVLYPPEIKDTREAQAMAKDELHNMGPMSGPEKIMLAVFIGCLVLWATATITNISATIVALLGIVVLLITKVLEWNDVKKEAGAWDTMIWMGTLIALAGALNKLGFIGWVANTAGAALTGISWMPAFIILLVIYCYIHYVFASLSAHIAALYVAMVTVAIGVGAPPMLALLAFAFVSNLCMALTHYAAGPSPIIYGSGFVTQGEWWKLGFIFSVVYLVIWVGLGSLWWSLIGLL